jgi:hypothetical protein
MNVSVARMIFNRMPDPVFDMWLRPIIGRIGWPFESERSSTRGTDWNRLFLGFGIQVTANLRWERRELPFFSISFSPISQSTICAMSEHHLLGMNNRELARIADSHERFMSFQKLILRDGGVPAPCVLMLKEGSYSILDGNHRIGAFASLPQASGFNLDTWVGS